MTRTAKPRSPRADVSKLPEWLKENDLQLWIENPSYKDLGIRFRRVTEQMGTRIPGREFKELVREHCVLYKHESRPRFSQNTALTNSSWDRLTNGIKTAMQHSTGLYFLLNHVRNFHQAAAIVGYFGGVSCDETVLRNSLEFKKSCPKLFELFRVKKK